MPQVEAASQLGSWAWNLDTEDIQWSAQMFRIFGLEVAQQAPPLHEMAQFFSVDGWRQIQDHIAKARVSGHSYLLEVQFKPRDGTWGWCRVHAEVMNRGDSSQGFLVGTCQDITAHKRLSEALDQSRSDLRRLILQVEHAQEDERRRIARDLHDDLQQNLAAMRMLAWQLGEHLKPLAAPASNLSAELMRLVDITLESIRRVVKDLHPQALDRFGLINSLEILTQEFACQTHIPGQFRLLPGNDSVWYRDADPDIAVCLYRIAQEGLNNIRKHANASWFEMELDLNPTGGVALTLRDNGHGLLLPPQRSGGAGTGLLSMRERVKYLGGTVQLCARQPQGLELRVSLPYWHLPVIP